MRSIEIGSVSMPLSDFVVSRNAILGITKSGKTYTAKGVAEQLLVFRQKLRARNLITGNKASSNLFT